MGKFSRNFIERLKSCYGSREFVVLGTTRLARIANFVLKQNQLKVVSYMNSQSSDPTLIIDNLSVLTPTEAREKFPNAVIIVGILDIDNQRSAIQEMRKIGFVDFIDIESIMLFYYTEIGCRDIDERLYMNMIDSRQSNSEHLLIRDLVLYVTDFCSLRCKSCSAFVPYINEPKHQKFEVVIESITRLANSVDEITTVNILGGEPLLYPQLSELCQAIARIPNIINIRIVTNGNSKVEETIIKDIINKGIYFHISNYDLSSKKDCHLIEILDHHGSFFEELDKNTKWFPIELPFERQQTTENKQLIYQCPWRGTCPELRNGELHLCGYISSGRAMGLIPQNKITYVDLMDNKKSQSDRRKGIKSLLNKEINGGCYYCGYKFNELIERAVQL